MIKRNTKIRIGVVHTNMQVASKILLKIRDKGFNFMEALEKGIQKISFQKMN
ncbi:hypothetical protein [Caviibacter abscessus]|uniref:hypothetical protein n=1 Tax=Caviibacter abscessus TaxID=1766719 RepID=UPI0018D23CC2|nr:hypothetical protein [Caviibacter abscessus]